MNIRFLILVFLSSLIFFGCGSSLSERDKELIEILEKENAQIDKIIDSLKLVIVQNKGGVMGQWGNAEFAYKKIAERYETVYDCISNKKFSDLSYHIREIELLVHSNSYYSELVLIELYNAKKVKASDRISTLFLINLIKKSQLSILENIVINAKTPYQYGNAQCLIFDVKQHGENGVISYSKPFKANLPIEFCATDLVEAPNVDSNTIRYTIIKEVDSVYIFTKGIDFLLDTVKPSIIVPHNFRYTITAPSNKGKYWLIGVKQISNPFYKRGMPFIHKFEIK